MNNVYPITPEESRREAYRHSDEFSGTQRDRVFAYIQREGDKGVSDEDIRKACGMRINSVTPCRGMLANLGLIDLHPTKEGRNDSGARVCLWVATGKPYNGAEASSLPRRFQRGSKQIATCAKWRAAVWGKSQRSGQ